MIFSFEESFIASYIMKHNKTDRLVCQVILTFVIFFDRPCKNGRKLIELILRKEVSRVVEDLDTLEIFIYFQRKFSYKPYILLIIIAPKGIKTKTKRIYAATYNLFLEANSASFSAAIKGILCNTGIPNITATPSTL